MYAVITEKKPYSKCQITLMITHMIDARVALIAYLTL
jgi:hypothetical protein